VRRIVVGVFVAIIVASLAHAQTVQVLHRFNPSPSRPAGPLVQVPSGDFYGITVGGIIRVTPGGDVTQVVRMVEDIPVGALLLASDGGLWGATQRRGQTFAGGTIFRLDPATGTLRTVHRFNPRVDGADPLGSLVEVGGSLYGVARSGAGSIFHVVMATGAVVTDFWFPGSPDPINTPITPLTAGGDGLLYGLALNPSFGNLYRFNPATGAFTHLRGFATAEGAWPSELTLGSDGSLYGSARLGGLEDAGTIFRYTPGTGLFQRIYSLTPSGGVDGRNPGPLVQSGDGHFYGVTDAGNNPASTTASTIFRLRAGVGGTFTYETIAVLDRLVSGKPSQAKLTVGADGLIYGFAQQGGPNDTGTIFRFDPAGGGPPENPISFTVRHAFPVLTTWNPSTPRPASDNFLYGLTNAGGAARRGAAYRLNPGIAAVTTLGEVPGIAASRVVNGPLTQGPDGQLYGNSVQYVPIPGTSNEQVGANHMLRVDPSTGAVTVATSGNGVPPELVRTPAGALYGMIAPPGGFVRFDPLANSVTVVAALLTTAGVGVSQPTATTDGQVYALGRRHVGPVRAPTTVTSLLRLNLGSAAGYDEIDVPQELFGVDRLVEGADGTLYTTAVHGGALTAVSAVVAIDRTTAAVRRVCTLPPPLLTAARYMTLGPDGALYGLLAGDAQRLFRCDPATGAVRVTVLPPNLGPIVGPMTAFGDALYGATRGVTDLSAYGMTDVSGGVIFRLVLAGPPPALDSDGDGLPNTWETRYGFDTSGGGGNDGAAGDPDGDGRTNAEELAAGTHPRGFVTRLFAEGATGPFFRTRFDFTAPSSTPATVRVRFLTDAGAVVGADVVVPPLGHLDLDPATLPGLAHANFSTIVESDADLAVDRTMTWDASGYGSHLETGITAPSTTWYFAEGSTSGEFALFYLLQNPQSTAVTATVTYLRPLGLAPVVRNYTLPPNSRTTIVVDDETDLASTDVSAAISATGPIVAERAMYLNRPGQAFGAGHESAGVTAPATEWFLAEGATGTFFDLFVLIANPNDAAAAVQVEYLRPVGGSLTKTYTMPARSRMTIWVDDEELPAGSGQKPFAAGSVSTIVRSTNAVPIIVERAMWWPGPEMSSDFWYEAHNSPGTTGTATRWVLGGAELGGSDDAETYVLIANTSDTASQASLILVDDAGSSRTTAVAIPAKSRTTVALRSAFSAGGTTPPNGRFGVIVETGGMFNLFSPAVPIVVERATYASPGGVLWSRGGNALAAPVP
jgi:uncharacterized repeat protein (TIGR03803 family)